MMDDKEAIAVLTAMHDRDGQLVVGTPGMSFTERRALRLAITRLSAPSADDAGVHGVAIIGRPSARPLDDGFTLEVTRVATDETRNACSILYASAWRAARALGYRKLITYTMQSESGASLRAAGWRVVAEVRGRSWSCKSRPRVDHYPLQDKLRWEA